MLKLVLSILLIVAFTGSAAMAGDIKPPHRDPVPTTEAHAAILREGIALHDQGKYAEAAAKYEQVLAGNPDDVLALYELAFSLQSAGEYAKSLEVGTRGATYRSEHLSKFYTVIGTAHDVLGRPKEAIEAYMAGVKVAPDDPVLRYNLAVTYAGMQEVARARGELKVAAEIRPDYGSAHLALAQLFFDDGYRVPALLAAARFCVLEFGTKRSAAARDLISRVLQGGVEPGSKPNEISITLDLNSKKDEGDFGTIEMTIGLSKAVDQTESGKGKSEVQQLVGQWETILGVLSELKPAKDRNLFTGRYYVPYFIAIKKKGFVEPFVYVTLLGSDVPGVAEWLRANDGRVKEFLAWSQSYAWPVKSEKGHG